jgi:hypothetical protein
MQVTAFWYMAPCMPQKETDVSEVYFYETTRRHTLQNAVILILAAVRS